MRQTNRAFTPREINFGLWMIVGAALLAAAGMIANTWLLAPSLGEYGQVEARHASSGTLDARPLVDASVQAVAASAASTMDVRVATAG